MYFSCEKCGTSRHVHRAYYPSVGDSSLLVCAGCGKEYELHSARDGMTVEAVPEKAEQPGPRGEY